MRPNKFIPAEIHVSINEQIHHLKRYLTEAAPHVVDEQRHLEPGTEERAYWHYGYMQALRDVQNMFNE